MSITNDLLTLVLDTAKAQGLDQKALATKAGVRAETISRAKQRGTADLDTVAVLARASGLSLVLVPTASTVPAREAGASPLTDPKWGLAWSNPNASDASLVTNALLKGSFTAILEAALHHGPGYVRSRWVELNRVQPMKPKAREFVAEILNNIEEGFAHVEA